MAKARPGTQPNSAANKLIGMDMPHSWIKSPREGFIALGGPMGEGDGDDAMLVVDAPDEETVVSRLADDCWKKSGMLVVKSIQRWTILLEAEG